MPFMKHWYYRLNQPKGGVSVQKGSRILMKNMSNLTAGQVLGAEKHPRTLDKVIQYGTAGFRTKAELLDHVMYRMGLLAVLRSKFTKATIGVMITASHNAEPDNGVKLVDPHGEMLEPHWEVLATTLANVPDDGLASCLEAIVKECQIDLAVPAQVFVGMDTRPSSPALAQAVIDGVQVLGGSFQDFGLVSTPQLHFVVTCYNTQGEYGEPTEDGYFRKLSDAFKKFRGEGSERENYKPCLRLDGANGVGYLKAQRFQELLGDTLRMEICNKGEGKLNFQCGADYVKVEQRAPEGLKEPGVRCASLDGDADRLVYYYTSTEGKFRLLDGDKIATLLAAFLKELVTASGLDLNLGLVQTAYANGSSTEYINKTLNVEVACVPTGVKHLHHRALEFDIGVYFEANGHGTVVLSPSAIQKVKTASQDGKLEPSQRAAAERFSLFLDIINQTVGDALSDLLLVETVLHAWGWNIEQWDLSYTDLPNRQLKVSVQDRNVITTTDAERVCVTPAGLQDAINELANKVTKGRSFVRPSGTEDIVRVYAEAATQEEADRLAVDVAKAVFDLAGGIGKPPQMP